MLQKGQLSAAQFQTLLLPGSLGRCRALPWGLASAPAPPPPLWGSLKRAAPGHVLDVRSPGFSVDAVLSLLTLSFLGSFFYQLIPEAGIQLS